MSYKFAKVKLPHWDRGYWRLCVDSLESFEAYWDIKAGSIAQIYMNAKQNDIDKQTTPQKLFHLFIDNYDKNPNNRKRRLGITDDIRIISDRVADPYNKAFFKYGGFYVNMAGGFFPMSNDVEVLDIIESEKYSFPDDSESKEDYIKMIQISKWRNGTHWYAKIGEKDVVIDNEQKWNTYQTAYNNAIIFINKYLIK